MSMAGLLTGPLSFGLSSAISRAQGGGEVIYDTDAAAYFARRATNPGTAYKGYVNDVIVGLKAAGKWGNIHGLYLTRDPVSRADAKLNIKGNAAYDLVEVGTLTWAANKGFTGDGATGYLETNYAFAAGMQNSSHFGYESDSDGQGAGNEVGADVSIILQTRSATDSVNFRLHAGTNTIVASQFDSSGHHIVSRTASTVSKWFQNGALRGTSAVVSAAPVATTLRFLARSGASAFSAKGFRVGHMGDGLTDTECATISSIIKTKYSNKIGAMNVFYGDSLTEGTQGGANNPWPGIIQGIIGNRCFNKGVPGETASQIRTRWLADTTHLGDNFIVWAGRNDGGAASALTPIADMVARAEAANPGKWMVLGVTMGWNGNNDIGSAAYNTIIDFNTALAAAYGSRYLEMHAPLLALGAPGGEFDEPASYALGRYPTAIRGDASVHFNNTGNSRIASLAYAKGQSIGLWP